MLVLEPCTNWPLFLAKLPKPQSPFFYKTKPADALRRKHLVAMPTASVSGSHLGRGGWEAWSARVRSSWPSGSWFCLLWLASDSRVIMCAEIDYHFGHIHRVGYCYFHWRDRVIGAKVHGHKDGHWCSLWGGGWCKPPPPLSLCPVDNDIFLYV